MLRRDPISFWPATTCPQCKLIKLVQTVQAKDNQGNVVDWSKARIIDGDIIQAVTTKAGWHVDFWPGKWKQADGTVAKGQASIYYRDNQTKELADKSQDGSSLPDSTGDASLYDEPRGQGGWKYSFETCARCADYGQGSTATLSQKYLGCVTWGFDIPNMGGDFPATAFHTPNGANQPSQEFQDAVKAFNKYYGTTW